MKDGVVAILENGEGRYLFIRRGLAIARAPGWWCFVGGEVEAGESLTAAMVREVREEVGLRVTVHEKVHECTSLTGDYLLHWFLVKVDPPDQVPAPHPHEVAEVRWLDVAEGLRLDPILPGLKAWLEAKK